MKILKYTYILGASALITITSCKKVVDILPTDTIETTKAYENTTDLDKGALGAYSALYEENHLYTAAIMSDEVRWAADNVARNYGIEHKWDFDSGAGNVTAAWANLYTTIDRVNRALAAADKITVADATDGAKRDRIKGELLAIRAFSHFELLRNFAAKYEPTAAGVPVMLVSEISLPARKTFGEVIAAVEADLAAAKTLIPASYAVSDYSRITRVAVSAIQARVALYNKEWDNAITYATEVINARPLATASAYPAIWTDASNTEVLFKLIRTTTTLNALWTDTNKDVFFSPSYKLIDSYDKVNDVRYATFIKQDLTVGSGREQWKVNKYPGQTSTILFNHVKVFRTSEMYLIRAEGYAQKATPDLAGAAASINALRANRITGYSNVSYSTAAAAIADIDLERFRELAFEGHRYYDYRRRFTSIVRDPRDLTTAPNIKATLNTSDRNYELPIPTAELLANPNVVQNANY
ncbi:RagB/SusD family nutrient uptake outer membrane protein [Pedobacter aquatilis]|uniref:RagB/SusD family nutrient uptake outer membrane protein n=1 Tax=Pedobacter aquatilis TaxID=351343 RepID=UPI002930C8D2|nr:RagB/SusD family nutrient uptake outer membrane protein [Pedobacter aquatilis]